MIKKNEITRADFNETLASIPDLAIIGEAAERLQKAFRNEFGVPLRYGTFRFVYHDGQLMQVEEHPKNWRLVLVSKRQLSDAEDLD